MASTTATPKSNRDGLAALDEALQAGAATLQRLEEQGEQLHQTEIVADSNKYLLDRSAREIRGMTWSGWLQNQFTSGPAVPKPPPIYSRCRCQSLQESCCQAYLAGGIDNYNNMHIAMSLIVPLRTAVLETQRSMISPARSTRSKTGKNSGLPEAKWTK